MPSSLIPPQLGNGILGRHFVTVQGQQYQLLALIPSALARPNPMYGPIRAAGLDLSQQSSQSTMPIAQLLPPRIGKGPLGLAAFPRPLGVPGIWNMVLSDNFDGPANSAPNTVTWNYWNVNTLRWDAMNRQENTYLDGSSNLVMRITNADIGHGVELSAGGLESVLNFGPGAFFEFRAALGNTGHATVWVQTENGMNGTNTPPDPADGCETDIGEYAPSIPLQTNVIWGGYSTNEHQNASALGIDQTQFHTYGMRWNVSNGTNDFYVDGVLSRQVNSIVSTRTDHVMRCTIEHNFGASTSATALVDYARAWVPA